MPAIVVKSGPKAGRRVELEEALAIGRQDGDLVLEDPEVSRRHAVVRRSGDSVVVEDLDSTNGTFVNGERIQVPRTLGPGDELRIGRTTLEVESDPRTDDTIVSQPAPRVDDTIMSPLARPDVVRSARAAPSRDPRTDYDDATQPLPSRTVAPRPRPARSTGGRLWVLAVVLVALTAVAYAILVDHRSENDFAARASDACAASRRSAHDVDLSRTPTRAELRRARNIRLQALGAIRALERPEDVAVVDRFLSAFVQTNASIAHLEAAIGVDNREIARARATVREDVKNEGELAAKAGIGGCGGLAFQ